MNDAQRATYCQYRIEKARDAYDIAIILAEREKWNAAINHYTVYYAVSALLVNHGIEAKSHTGIKTQFFFNFVKTSHISLENAKLYADLFDGRQKGDYGDFFYFEAKDVLPLLSPVKQLVEKVELLAKNTPDVP